MTSEKRKHSPSGFGKNSLAPERNPWASEELVERAILYRGAIVSGFGQLETGLGEVALRIWSHPLYRPLREKPPYGASKTVGYLKEVFAAPGPLHRHHKIADLFLTRFLGFSEMRTMMAHGALSALPNWGITFEYINRASGGRIEKRSQRFSEEQLSEVAGAVNRLSRLGQRLYWRANLHTELPDSQWHPDNRSD